MDNQRTKMLGENLTHYRNLQENGSVNLIEFHTTDNRKFGIGNPDAIKLLLSAAVTELERQLHIRSPEVYRNGWNKAGSIRRQRHWNRH